MWVAFVLFPFWSVKFASWITKRRKLSLHKDGAEADINCSLKSSGWKDPSSVSLLRKRFTYLWNRNHHKSAKKFWGKESLFWRGLCNILQLGWYSTSDSPEWRELWQFLSYSREETCRLDTAFTFNSIPDNLPVSQLIPKMVSYMDKLFFILKYMLKWKADSWHRRIRQ